MKLYASFEPSGGGGWGDCFPALFFTEWLYQNRGDDDLDIVMFDLGAQAWGKNDWRLRDHIEKPEWISEWLDEPPVIVDSDIDAVLATHYSHPRRDIKKARAEIGLETMPIQADEWDHDYGGWLPPAKYKGTENLGILRLHNDAWWATLIDKMDWRPTMPKLLDPPELIGPPYVAIQLRRDEISHEHKPGRNMLSGEEFDEWARGLIKGIDETVVLLSDEVDIIEDRDHAVIIASHLGLWQKIHIAHHASIFVGAHSGFGGICASYAKKSFGVNISLDGGNRNPPICLFDNVNFTIDGDVYTAKGPYLDVPKGVEIQTC